MKTARRIYKIFTIFNISFQKFYGIFLTLPIHDFFENLRSIHWLAGIYPKPKALRAGGGRIFRRLHSALSRKNPRKGSQRFLRKSCNNNRGYQKRSPGNAGGFNIEISIY